MPREGEFKIEGLKELDEQIAALGAVAGSKVLYSALFAALKPVQDSAKERAPFKSGKLRKSIKRQRLKGAKLKNLPFRADAAVIVKSDLFYAEWVERGIESHTVSLRQKTRGKGTKSLYSAGLGASFGPSVDLKARAKPFIRPAYDKNRFVVLDLFKKKLQQRIKTVLKRAKKK